MADLQFGKIYYTVEVDFEEKNIPLYKYSDTCVGLVTEQFGSKMFVPYTGIHKNKPLKIFPEDRDNCCVVISAFEEGKTRLRLDEQKKEDKRNNSDFVNHPIYLGVNSDNAFFRILYPEVIKKADIAFNKLSIDTSEVPQKLKKFGEVLTDKEYYTDPAIGREKEIDELQYSLLTYKKNPLLIGKPGTGKSAIVEGFAYRIQRGLVPDEFRQSKIIYLDSSMIVSGTRYRGDYEQNMQEIIQCLIESPNTIPFIDEFHNLVGLGRTSESGSLDAANILKPYLASGKIKIIGATTQEEYEKYILADGAFRRRFETVTVLEPSEKETCDILLQTLPGIENVEGIRFPFEGAVRKNIISVIVKATLKNNRIETPYNNNPDLALTILYKIFASAKKHNRKSVDIEDLLIAIDNYNELKKSYKKTFKDDVEELAQQFKLK